MSLTLCTSVSSTVLFLCSTGESNVVYFSGVGEKFFSVKFYGDIQVSTGCNFYVFMFFSIKIITLH